MFDRTLRILAPAVMSIVVVAVILRLIGYATDEPQPPPQQDSRELVQFGQRGGMCADGPCETTYVLYADGRVSNGEVLSEEALSRALDLVAILEATDYSSLDLSDCGESTFDGSDDFVQLQKSQVTVETCHKLPARSETAYRDLWALLSLVTP